MAKNLRQTCVKCEELRYANSNVGIIDTFTVKYLETNKKYGRGVFTTEELIVTCSRCGYSWNEPCADAKKEDSNRD